MLKKISLAVMGLAANGLVSAGTMGPVCIPGSVTVPCVESYWEFGAQALYLRGVFATQNAFTLSELINPFAFKVARDDSTTLLPLQNPFNIGIFNPFHEIPNNWNWGSLLQGAYHFNTGNDITINWLHYNNNVTDNWTNTVLVGDRRPIEETFDFEFYGQNRFDQVNIELGQLARTGTGKKIRFFGGLQIAHVDVDAETCFTFDNSQGPFYKNNKHSVTAPLPGVTPGCTFNNTDFKGLGAVAGIDYAYYLTDKLSLTANGSASLLAGTSGYNAGIIDDTGELVIASVNRSITTVVPTLQGKFGANYALMLQQGILNLQVGYLALNYFNVLSTQPLGNFGVISNTDYALGGPYAGVSFVGNV